MFLKPTQLPAQNTWLGKRVLNNFTWFYHSHLFMFVVFYIAAILHPWPGTPGYSHTHGHSITWVRCRNPVPQRWNKVPTG